MGNSNANYRDDIPMPCYSFEDFRDKVITLKLIHAGLNGKEGRLNFERLNSKELKSDSLKSDSRPMR